MCPSPWTRPIRTFQTSQLRFILPIRSDRSTGPSIGSTRERPDQSFVQILDQMLELTELKPVSPGQLDKPRLIAKPDLTWIMPDLRRITPDLRKIMPDLTWIMRFHKMIETSLFWLDWLILHVPATVLMD